MDFSTYDAADFAANASFQEWVAGTDPRAARHWERWANDHPEKATELAEARRLLAALRSSRNLSAYPAERAEALRRFQTTLDETGESEPIVRRLNGRWPKWAAAAVVVLALGGLLWWSLRLAPVSEELVRRTDFGKTDVLNLPDGTRVTLNANSKLTHSTRWTVGRDREVWLDGEAFFEVSHREAPRTGRPVKFTVHTAGVDIEVLGTRFNVRQRRQRVQVVLNSGSIRLRLAGDSIRREVLMKPGQLVEVPLGTRAGPGGLAPLTPVAVRPEVFSAWKTRQFLFDHTPLSEVAEQIEDVYGWRVQFAEPALRAETLTGAIPTRDEAVFLEALATALNLDVARTDNHLLISRRH